MYNKIIKKVSDNHLYDAFKITLAAALPFVFFNEPHNIQIAFALALGAILNAPTDIPSNLKHKVIGLTLGSVCIALITFLLGVSKPYPILFYPIFTSIIFFASMIAVYGHRANLLSFVCLLTVSLSFAHPYVGWDLIINCSYLFAGGITYLIISLIFHYLKPKRYILLEVANCIEKTADYLELRASLWSEETDKNAVIEKQLDLQVKLNEYHENIREFLGRNKVINSNSMTNRKILISLTSLIEILEIATSNPFDQALIRTYFKSDPNLIKEYQDLAKNFALSLHKLSFSIIANKKYHSPVSLGNQLRALKSNLETFQKEHGWEDSKEEIIAFNTVMHYAEKQLEKIKGLERVYKERVNMDELRGKYKDIEKFLKPQHYRFSTLKENLNFSSSIFRHATRFTLTMLVGFVLGILLPLQNEYWILMTLVVIMRPGYGLTKSRTVSRVVGTIIGGVIAFTALFLIHNTTVILVLTVITMIIGYWLTHSDYKVGVIFITIYIIFLYGIITTNYQDLLVHRVIDTVIGALLALAANSLLWPSWEYLNIQTYLSKSILANKLYLQEIKKYYNTKGEPTTDYKLARKNAFIEVGNLMSSFQRMAQEPKSKQKNKMELYELTVLNQTLLSAAASIGTFIQSHETTEASKAFNIVMDKVVSNLKFASRLIDNNTLYDLISDDELKNYEINFLKIKSIRRDEIEQSQLNYQERIIRLEESQLIIDQLIWMINISEQIVKASKKIK